MRDQKTKWDGNEARSLAAWFKLFCCGINRKRNETISYLEGGVCKKCVESEMCITVRNEGGAKKRRCDVKGSEWFCLTGWMKLGDNDNFSSLVEVIYWNVEDGEIRNDDIKGTAHVSWFGKSQRGWVWISGTIQRKDSKYIG